jgi:AcrR family transcriptional regulator
MSTDAPPTPLAAEPAEPPPDGAVDGRRLRSERSRQAIVEALLSLLREGHARPSSNQVAERAGVTARTLFNHFGDMESLLGAASAAQLERVRSLRPRPPDADDRPTRLHSLADQLALLFEDTMHVRWAVLSATPPSPTSLVAVDTARAELRATIAEFLQPEVDALGAAGAERLLDALDPVCDPVAWRLRRGQQGLDPSAARRTLADTIEALVTHALATFGVEGSTQGPDAPAVAATGS